ncbi:hypothetical protein GGQ88_002949 [Novosphingobium hassiacum]|uniref:Uncharacterized protein n=1 Tax=Novosphingobium hassiacum TaxID=173676 RepID=A0A7W6EWW6_9SPHN|nr:hypothetical protein [Novosphingobium hassiacum]MBB3861661.1 hypothetical protein [Novosphingobium hassiacum]
MKAFFRNVSPRRALVDLWQVLGAPSEYRAIALVLAAMVTGGIFVVMSNQGGRGLPRPPVVTYFPSLIEGRSDAEILEENRVASAKARAEEAEEEASAERVRQMYKAVGNATGVDTKKAYDEGVAERTEEKRKIDAARKAILDKHLVDNPVFDAEQKRAQEQSPAQ